MNDSDANTSPTVLLVGHCGPDSWVLKSTVRRALDGADVQMINGARALEDSLDGASLLLVNRVLDGDFPTGSGIELIRQLATRDGHSAGVMLVSNFAEAQEEAEAAGALPGFGKADAASDEAARRMRDAAGVSRA